jgi:hypothetical protein
MNYLHIAAGALRIFKRMAKEIYQLNKTNNGTETKKTNHRRVIPTAKRAGRTGQAASLGAAKKVR